MDSKNITKLTASNIAQYRTTRTTTKIASLRKYSQTFNQVTEKATSGDKFAYIILDMGDGQQRLSRTKGPEWADETIVPTDIGNSGISLFKRYRDSPLN